MKRREIKFRAWDSDAKEMNYSNGLSQILYGGASDDIGLGLSLHWSVKNSYRGWHRDRDFYGDYEKGIIVLMQYTGLKDKNGVEIYEGDILTVEFGVGYSSKFYPSFKDGTQRRSQIVVEFDVHYQKYNTNPPNDENFFREFEVIGNIYENPELL